MNIDGAEMKTANEHDMEMAERSQQFCSFRIASSLYGIHISFVKEINPEFRITSVPHSPSSIYGLVNVRGEIYLVYNLRNCLGFEDRPIDAAHRIILFKNLDVEPCGVVVDRIADVIVVNPANIEQYQADAGINAGMQEPGDLREVDSRLIQGVYQMESEVLIILNIQAMPGIVQN